MSLLEKWLGKSEERQHPSVHNGWENIFGGATSTFAGVEVTVEGAMASAVVYACVRVLSESLAMLPLPVYRRLPNGGKERATNHPLYSILHDSPNPEMTSFEWRELAIQHCATWGNHFSEIETAANGRPIGLWPLRPDRMIGLQRVNGALRYEYSLPKGGTVYLRSDQVLHIRFMGNGLWGISPIRQQANSIGLDLGTEEYGARFFGNGARPGVVLKHPGVLSDSARRNISNAWTAEHGGLENAHRVRVLEEGMDLDTIGVPPEEAQFLETRKFQRSVIAGWFRIPPHLVGDLEKATYSNIEQQELEFHKNSLTPWIRRVDQRMGLSLLSLNERRTYFVEHLINALMWGDSAARASYYATAIQNGWMNRNEVRSLENLNPYEGGDQYLVPLNMGMGSDDSDDDDEDEEAAVEEDRALPVCECGHEHRQIETRADDDEMYQDRWPGHFLVFSAMRPSEWLPVRLPICGEVCHANLKMVRSRCVSGLKHSMPNWPRPFPDILRPVWRR